MRSSSSLCNGAKRRSRIAALKAECATAAASGRLACSEPIQPRNCAVTGQGNKNRGRGLQVIAETRDIGQQRLAVFDTVANRRARDFEQ